MKNSTINKKEIEKFSRMAEEWWNPTGKFKPLHKFNPIRIAYIRDNIIETINRYNPIGLTIEDEKWFLNILGLIDFKAGKLLASKSDDENRVGEVLLEIKTKFIIPKVGDLI